jgi:hypothetical protein
MKTLMILAAVASAALATAACGTTAKPPVVAAAAPTWNKTAEAKPFDTARSECWAETMGASRKGSFERCMATRGWTQS